MTERRPLSPSQKAQVRARQDHKCAECGKPLEGRVEFDHVLALALGGANDISNFEALCAKPCHQARTRVTVGMKSKADRARNFQETGHGRLHERKRWPSLKFNGERRG